MVWLKGCFVVLPQLPQNINWNENTRYKIRDKKPDGNLLSSESEEENEYQCTSCNCTFRSKSTLSTHEQFAHAKLNGLENDSTSEQETFSKPKPSLQSADEFRCGECDITFNQESSFVNHIQSVHPQLKCKEGNGTLEPETFDNCIEPSQPSHELSFRCEECDSTFDQRCNLKIHNRSVHPKVKTFKCDHCDNSFININKLNKHVKEIHGVLKPFKCTLCDKSFVNQHILTNHVNGVHEGLKPFKCTECDWAFAYKPALLRHIRNVHEKCKPFKCTQCDRAFPEKFKLRNHVNSVHEKSTLFTCTQCNYAFASNKSLTKHLSTAHEPIKPSNAVNGI